MLDFAHENRLLPRQPDGKTSRQTGCKSGHESGFGAKRLSAATRPQADVQTTREAWLLAIKQEIATGIYPLEEVLDGALDQLLDSVIST